MLPPIDSAYWSTPAGFARTAADLMLMQPETGEPVVLLRMNSTMVVAPGATVVLLAVRLSRRASSGNVSAAVFQ
jgi:hypothetical protein